MRPPRPIRAGALLLALAFAGCSEERSIRGDGDGAGGTGGSAPGATTIYDLRNPDHPARPGSPVMLRSVVVTGVVERPNEIGEWVPQHFFVQEQRGGKRSGIYVRNGSDGQPVVTPPAVGDVVDLAGTFAEYFERAQVEVTSLKNQGPGTVPAPAVVDPLAVATGGAEQEDWEGVLVEVRDVVNVEDPVLGTDGVDRGAFRVGPEGGTAGVIVGTLWRDDYRGKVGDAFRSIVGVMDFSFDEARLETRGNLDITFADGSHPQPPERVTVTIPQIQNPAAEGHPEPESPVRVEGAIVTAFSQRGFWIQDPAGGPWSGIFVFAPGEDATIPGRGAVVDVEGQYVEYWGLSEITLSLVEEKGTADDPLPEVVDAALLSSEETAEPWEGVLVEVRDVVNVEDPVLGTDGKDHGDFRVQAEGADAGVIVGASIGHDYDGTVGDAFLSIAGVLDYSFEAYRLQPRSNADITFRDGTHPVPRASDFTIQEIQNPDAENRPEPGDVVRVTDVAVVAVERSGSFYVADPAGGPWSGIYVFKSNPELPVPTVGDRVTIEGSYEEFYDNSQIVARSIEITGDSELPDPIVVEPHEIATGAPTAEAFEGVLVQVRDVIVTEAAVIENGADRGAFRVAAEGDEDPSDDLLVDDDFDYAYTDQRRVGDRFERITGLLDYSFDHFRLMPRGDEDLVPAP